MPLVSRTPVVRSSASWRKISRDRRPHWSTLSFGSTRYGPHIAPAASDVTPGTCSAITCSKAPASARTTAVVSPTTPAPTTTTRSPAVTSLTLEVTLRRRRHTEEIDCHRRGETVRVHTALGL